jgi:hypothetical protein
MTIINQEEMLLLAIYNEGNREESMEAIEVHRDILGLDSDMAELADSVINKLATMSDEEYLELDFSDYDAWIEDVQQEIDEEIADIDAEMSDSAEKMAVVKDHIMETQDGSKQL